MMNRKRILVRISTIKTKLISGQLEADPGGYQVQTLIPSCMSKSEHVRVNIYISLPTSPGILECDLYICIRSVSMWPNIIFDIWIEILTLTNLHLDMHEGISIIYLFSIHFLSNFCLFSLYFQSIFYLFSIHFLFIFYLVSINFLFIFYPLSIHFLSIFDIIST